MDYIKDNVLRKYLNGEIDTDIENNNVLNLDKELIKVCEGKTLLVKGEMTLIVGGKNSGKSKLMNYLIKQILIDELDLGFELKTKEDIKVISFDSEMGINRLIEWSIKSIYEDEFGLNYLKDNLQDILFLYSLKRISPEDRVNYICIIIEGLKKNYPHTHFIICLDVGTCLTSDTNSSSNGGVIDNLVNKLEGSTLIVTIHNSFKEDTKEAIGMGSIGTALEKYCAIKLLIKPTDEEKRHKIQFVVSKYEDINKAKDYFFINTEKKLDGKIFISGISDSDGLISIKKGNLKTDEIEFKSFLFDLINNSTSESDRFRKNIVPIMMAKFNYGKTSVFDKIKVLIEEGVIKEIDGELIIN